VFFSRLISTAERGHNLYIFFTWLASLTSQLELVTSRAKLAFWLVKITNRAELARYPNEPERAEPSRAGSLASLNHAEHIGVMEQRVGVHHLQQQ
jgi:hypothetical protein